MLYYVLTDMKLYKKIYFLNDTNTAEFNIAYTQI